MNKKQGFSTGLIVMVAAVVVLAAGIWYYEAHKELALQQGSDNLALVAPPTDTTAPSVPKNLAATGETTTTISLSWSASTDNVGVAGYIIYRNLVAVAKSPTASFTDTGLTTDWSYGYSVAAYDAAGNVSGESAAITVTTAKSSDTTPPSVPTGLKVTSVNTSTVSLSWTASTDNVGVTGYKIYRNGVQAGTSATASYTDGGLAGATTYTYTVSAYDAAGNNSAQSASVSATTLSSSKDITPPSIPKNLAVTATTASSISLSWSASTDNVGVAGYILYRNNVAVVKTANTSYTDTGLAAKNSYGYAVAAYDAAGNISGESAAITGTTQSSSDTTPPSVPTGLKVTATTGSSVSISWTASTDNVGVAGYKIYRNAVQVGTSATAAYTDSGLAGGTTYKYTVSAYDAAGNNSAQSASVSATTATTSGPSVPQNLAVTGTTTSTVSLSWSPSTETGGTIVGYEVFRGSSVVSTPVSTSYTNTGLTANTSYTYYVEALDSAGKTSGPSAPVTATTQGVSTTGAPVINYFNVAPAGILPDQDAILTMDVSSATAISVTYSPCSSGCNIGNGESSATFLLNPSQTTTYTVTAKNSAGTVTTSQQVVVGAYNNDPPPVPAGLSVPTWKACWESYGGDVYQGLEFDPTIPTPPHGLPLEASLYFTSATCGGGGDNLNDYQTLMYSGNQIWFFIHHPKSTVVNSSAIWSLGNLSSGCVNYTTTTPACS